jgi:peptidoglycan hydrolase-like protein with peptidoglycan-binding domain
MPHHWSRVAAAAGVLVLLTTAAPVAAAEPTHVAGEQVSYPLFFPVGGTATTGSKTHYWASRADGIHHAQDIMAPKMTPLYAVAAGTVQYVNWSRDPLNPNPARCCSLVLAHDDGWKSWYLHMNNDTPGTDDGLGWGIAPGIAPGVQVQAGQLIGWVGDSGNAENTSPHLHFELHDQADVIVDAFLSLRAAEGLLPPPCKPGSATPLAALLANTKTLRRGSSGPAVFELEGFLALNGFRPGTVDGSFTTTTYQAVRRFQKALHLRADGVIGPKTRAALLKAAGKPGLATMIDLNGQTLAIGISGPEVLELKRWLKAAGFDPITTDNVFDASTEAAVLAFQVARAGEGTGAVDSATRSALAGIIKITWPGTCPG